MIPELVIGKEVCFTEFYFNSGAGIAVQHIDTEHILYGHATIYLDRVIKGKVIKRWDDDETGERAWVELNPGYKTYTQRDGKTITLDVVYVGEFDLVAHNSSLVKRMKENSELEYKIRQMYDEVGEGFQEIMKKYRHYQLEFDHVEKVVTICGNDNSAKSAIAYLADKIFDADIDYVVMIEKKK